MNNRLEKWYLNSVFTDTTPKITPLYNPDLAQKITSSGQKYYVELSRQCGKTLLVANEIRRRKIGE